MKLPDLPDVSERLGSESHRSDAEVVGSSSNLPTTSNSLSESSMIFTHAYMCVCAGDALPLSITIGEASVRETKIV